MGAARERLLARLKSCPDGTKSVGVRKHGDVEDIYRQLESVAKTGRLAEQLAAVIKKLVS